MIRPGWAHTSAFYGALFLALGAHLPFWPLWLRDWGLTEAEVGLFTGCAIAARILFGVALPWIADTMNAPRRTLAAAAALGAVLFASHVWIETRPLLFVATLATAAVTAGTLPIADALSLRAAERGGFAYATARSVGSAAFLAANLLCGLAVARWGIDAALWWIALSFLPLIWLGWFHPGGAGAPVARPKLAEAIRLLRSPAFLLAMIAGAALQGAHAPLYAYGSIHWRAMGIEDSTIGALWAFGVAVEVGVLALFGKRLIEKLGAAGAFALSALASLLRWSVMAFDPGLVWLWPLQALHGLTFTAAHLGAMAFVYAAAPAHLGATAQGLNGALAGGALMAAGAFLAALIYPQFGAGAFWIGVVFSAVGLVSAIWLKRLWHGGTVI